MKLIWDYQTEVDPNLAGLMQTVADMAEVFENIRRKTAVHITFCDDGWIQTINAQYRGMDRSTDVLSFPLITYPKGKTAGECDELLRQTYDDETDACMLGDLLIAVPHIYAQAAEYGHSPEREAAYLFVHGLCHLMGYDHIQEDEKKIMREAEEKVMSAVGLAREDNGYISDDMLLKLAIQAKERSYSPYSHYRVGAALLCDDGRVFQGCNIENASYGLTNCAERTAVFKAVSEGETSFQKIAIAADGSAPWPCGACRQVLNEFAPGIRVLVTWDGNKDEMNLAELLPHGFGPKDLDIKKE